ncbi:MAG: SDR family oxidoreductase [Kofleriaceae bacterium]|nr:SDR family oxidoreductase [Kofleriaceae bacterium]
MERLQRLAGKHVVITGAGRGIGRAIAVLFAHHGANVTLWARSRDQLAEVAANIGPAAQWDSVDVSDSAAVNAAANQARGRHGEVDIIVNNAGSVIRGSVLDATDAQWHSMFAVNCDGTFFVCRAFGADIRNRRGRIINIASIAGRQGTAGLAAYCAAKHAVIGFTRALALELHGIATVNAICPGSVDTQMLQEGLPGAKPDMTPTDIANTAFFLATEAPPALSGSCIDVFG